MFLLQLKCLFVGLLLIISTCGKKKRTFNDMYATCGSSYQTSDLFFSEDKLLTINLRFIYFADSINEIEPDYDKILVRMNKFFEVADIKFRKFGTEKIVDSDTKGNMPSFIKTHFQRFKNDSTITCYIYGNFQPYYTGDEVSVAGASGGLGTNFFAVKRAFLSTITVEHEISHNFGLLHVFLKDESEKGYSYMTGDLVCDTRKVDDPTNIVDETCNYIGDDKTLTEEEKRQMVCNYMTWSYLNCRNCITDGQIRRMRFYIHESQQLRHTVHNGLNEEIQ